MKVLFTFGGLPHYLVAQLNRLNEKPDIEVVVVVPSGDRKTIGQGVKQTDKGMNFKVYYTSEYITYYKKPFLKSLKEIITKEHPDIFVTMWPYVLSLVFLPGFYLFLKRKKIKILLKEIPFMVPEFKETIKYYKNNPVYNEDMIFESNSGIIWMLKSWFLAYVRKLYYNKLDATVNYIDEAKDIISSYGLNKEKIFISYNSPDTDELFKAAEIVNQSEPIFKYNRFRLIHVGRLVKWKKVDLLINAVAKLISDFPETELLVIGGGPETENLKQLTDKLNVNNNVKFVGGIYDNVLMGKYFSSSGIYVLAGMGGLSINEAMCFAKPVVCSVCDGTEKKLVKDNFNGKFFINNNLESLVDAIRFIFNNEQTQDQMGKNSLSIIKNEVNINTVVDTYVKAFAYVITK